jgi:AraC family transcriptional regulator
MTYPFKFAHVDEPSLACGAERQWGGLSVKLVTASAGLHEGPGLPDHRVLFYGAGSVPTHCRCDGLSLRRLQTPGDFDIVPAGVTGSWEDEALIEIVSVRLTTALVNSTGEALGVPGGRVELTPKLGARDPLIEHVVRALFAELTAPAPVGRLYADSLAVALASRLVSGFSTGAGLRRQTLSKPQLRRIVDYVEANLDSELSLARLACVAGMSVPHLTALFRRTLGLSLHRYVVERRVERARLLLLAGDRSIVDVAADTGFAHQSHMARWMKRILGVRPSDLFGGG